MKPVRTWIENTACTLVVKLIVALTFALALSSLAACSAAVEPGDSEAAPLVTCSDSYSPALCGEDDLYESCSEARTTPQGCTAPLNNTAQDYGVAWCCPVEWSQLPKGPTGH